MGVREQSFMNLLSAPCLCEFSHDFPEHLLGISWAKYDFLNQSNKFVYKKCHVYA